MDEATGARVEDAHVERACADLRRQGALFAGIDLLVLNAAPLEVRGRLALRGILVLDADPVARVRWESTTRKVYRDERPRIERAHREFPEAVRHG